MDLANIKMVVTDMDGTLLNSNHEVSDRFFSLFDALHKRGILFVAASGRQYHSMVEKLSTIKDKILFAAENGALVIENEKQLLSTPLEIGYLSKILNTLNTVRGAHPVLCSPNTAFAIGASQEFLEHLKEYYTKFEVVQSLTDINQQILKIAVYHFENSERYLYPAMAFMETELKVKVSGTNWLDISAREAHKGFALEKIMKANNVAANEVLVFGDYNNDLEMLQLSNYSFAMANAHPHVKKVAKFETKSNDEQGVEHILEQLLYALDS